MWLCGALACATPAAVSPALSADHAEPELVSVDHVVRPGETLYRIARAYGLTADELAAANGVSDPTALRVGQTLTIPGATSHADPAAGSAPSDSDEERPGTVHVKPAPTAADDARKGTLRWPLRGVLYARFGKRGKEAHDGIDLSAPQGTPVLAAADGVVLFAGEQRGYGRIAIIAHEQDLVTLYAHNQDIQVKTGQRVKAGERVASVGESGRTTGPHLHFEVRRAGVPVNPMDYLGPIPPR